MPALHVTCARTRLAHGARRTVQCVWNINISAMLADVIKSRGSIAEV